MSRDEEVRAAYKTISHHINCHSHPTQEDPLFQEIASEHTTLLMCLQRYINAAAQTRIKTKENGEIDWWDQRISRVWAEHYINDPVPFI